MKTERSWFLGGASYIFTLPSSTAILPLGRLYRRRPNFLFQPFTSPQPVKMAYTKSNTTCLGREAIPDLERYPIPKDRNWAFLPAGDGNALSPWLANCCLGPISLIDNCYFWCEIPGVNGPANGQTEKQLVMARFGDCLRSNGRDINKSNIVSYYWGGDAASRSQEQCSASVRNQRVPHSIWGTMRASILWVSGSNLCLDHCDHSAQTMSRVIAVITLLIVLTAYVE